MVAFDFNRPIGQQSWTLTVPEGADGYLQTLRGLLRVLASQNSDMLSQDDNYSVLSLIEHLLPTEEQLEGKPPKPQKV